MLTPRQYDDLNFHIRTGDLGAVEVILAQATDEDAPGLEALIGVSAANASIGGLAVIKALLTCPIGQNLNTSDALWRAIDTGNPDVVPLILKQSNAAHRDHSALHSAIRIGDDASALLVLAAGDFPDHPVSFINLTRKHNRCDMEYILIQDQRLTGPKLVKDLRDHMISIERLDDFFPSAHQETLARWECELNQSDEPEMMPWADRFRAIRRSRQLTEPSAGSLTHRSRPRA